MSQTKEQEKKSILLEIMEKINMLAAAGLGVVAALAWNEAIKAILEYFLPSPEGGVLAKIIYAVVITVIVVVATILLARYTKKVRKIVEK